MKKSRILVVGLIALLMAGGLVLAGCNFEGDCPNNGCTVSSDGSCGLVKCAVEYYKNSPTKGPVPPECDC